MASTWINSLKKPVIPVPLSEEGCGDNLAKWQRRERLLIQQERRLRAVEVSVHDELMRLSARIISCDEAITTLKGEHL